MTANGLLLTFSFHRSVMNIIQVKNRDEKIYSIVCSVYGLDEMKSCHHVDRTFIGD
jgi:hypothetical protein